MHNVSRGLYLHTSPFPLSTQAVQETVTMANKLSRPINEGGERADTVGVCSGMGHISVTTTWRGNKFLIRCHIGTVSIQSECWQEINNKQEVGVCVCIHVFTGTQGTYLSHVGASLIHPLIRRRTLINAKPHLWMWWRWSLSYLIARKLLQRHDVTERKSPIWPPHRSLYGQLHHVGSVFFTNQPRGGGKRHFLYRSKNFKARNTHAGVCVRGVRCRNIWKVLIEQREVRLCRRTALFLQIEI